MNIHTPRIADLLAAHKAATDPEAELASLLEAIDRLLGDQADARRQLAAVDAERDALLLAEDEAGLGRIDKRAIAARRKIEMVDLAVPKLKARADEVREAVVRNKVAKHIDAARAARDRVEKAVDELMAANGAAERVFGAAIADLGASGARAELFVPQVAYYGIVGAQGAANWKRGLGLIFEGPPQKAPQPGFHCRVIAPNFTPYRLGETIFLSEAEARSAVEVGAVEYVDPASVPPVFDPRKVPMPEPVGDRVTVLFLRAYSIADRHPDTGAYRVGDVATLQDLRNAQQLVRNGYAEWWMGAQNAAG